MNYIHLPSKTAPAVSQIEARMHACLNVRTFEPTDVPKALATSLAPMPRQRINARKNPTTTIHMKSGSMLTMMAFCDGFLCFQVCRTLIGWFIGCRLLIGGFK